MTDTTTQGERPWWIAGASQHEREQHTEEELERMAMNRLRVQVADDRVRELSAEIDRLWQERDAALGVVGMGAWEKAKHVPSVEGQRRSDEIGVRIELLQRELEDAKERRNKAEGRQLDTELAAGAVPEGEDW